MSLWTRMYRLLAALLCLIGLGIQFGLQAGRFDAYLLNYFTVQSNMVCLALWVALLIRPTISPTVRGVAAQGILLTMTVFHFLLSGGGFAMGDGGMTLFQVANLLLHYVCPTMMILDFLLLGEKKPLSWRAPWIWTVFPVAYLVYIFLRGATGIPISPSGGSAYPYFFLDPGAAGFTGNPQGASGVAIWVVILYTAYVLAGYAMRGLYLLLGRLKRSST